jgi:hypothetical protein
MRKRNLHHLWVRIRPLSYWYFLIGAVICLVVALAALRQNNLTALKLRDKVIAADQQNGDVEGALKELRGFVYTHMNTDLASGPNAIRPPIQLKYHYERLVKAEEARVAAENEKTMAAAQNACVAQPVVARVTCVQQYVAQHGTKAAEIPEDLYKFDFASPRWSPDLAGLSLLLGGVRLLLFDFRFLLEQWLRHQLEV